MDDACDEHTVFAFGSSVLLAAFDPLPARPPGRWTVSPATTPTGQQLRIVTRYGGTDLRLFRPLLAALPRCPKTIVLHSDVFVPRGFKRPKWSEFYYTFVYRIRQQAERLWPEALQRRTRTEVARPLECDDACLAKRRDAMARRFGAFAGISDEHREIVRELIENGARVVVLDVGRSELLEAEFSDELARFRSALGAFAESRPEIDYLAFDPQQNEFYADYTHLNESGRSLFGGWIAETAALRGRAP